ncbi:MAG: stalk domain-containing protein [Bacillota bacterium]
MHFSQLTGSGYPLIYWNKGRGVFLAVFTLLLVFVFMGVYAPGAQAGQLEWKQVFNPPGEKIRNLNSVAYGGGVYVAVGNKGAILSSTDGKLWVRCISGSVEDMTSVKYLNNRFVVISKDLLVTSENGTYWEIVRFNNVADITFGKGKYIAVDKTGEVYSSADIKTWTRLTVPGGKVGLDYAGFVNNRFYAGGVAANLLVSDDGEKWDLISAPAVITGIIYNGQKYLALSVQNKKIYSSENGTDHWKVEKEGLYYGLGLDELLSNSDKYAIINGKYIMSPDGITRMLHIGNSFDVSSVLANGSMVAVGSDGSVMKYPGDNWSEPALNYNFSALAYQNGTFIAAGQSPAIATSKDGQKWIIQGLKDGEKYDAVNVVQGGGLYVKMGLKGSILTSPDGVSWTGAQLPAGAEPVSGIAFGKGRFVAVSGGNKLLVSSDGVKWGTVEVTFRPSFKPTAIAYGNSQFVAASGDRFFTSSDGLIWEEQKFRCEAGLSDITFGNGRFAALHSKGYILATELEDVPQQAAQSQTPTYLFGNIYMDVDGRKIGIEDETMLVVNGRVMVPLRMILESLGAKVGWEESTQTVTVVKGSRTVTLRIGDSVAKINNNTVIMSPPALVKNGRTMVPIRFISEALGAKVDWDGNSNTVRITAN